MITAVLDTNVIVQAVIGSGQAASARVLVAYAKKRFRLAFSQSTLEELHQVLIHPRISGHHGWTDDELRRYFTFLLANAAYYRFVASDAPSSLTRDVTDTKFLDLAALCGAPYLVTNDRRHLLPVRHHKATQIVTPNDFLHRLS